MERYHLRKKDKQIVDENELSKIMIQGKYATIAMCRDNEPYIVTLSYGYDQSKNALYFHTGSVGLKIDFMIRNPHVCATVIDDGGYMTGQCNHRYRSVVINGKISVVQGLEEKKYGLEIMLDQLEDHPSVVKDKLLKNENAYDSVCILRLDIETIIGKSEQW